MNKILTTFNILIFIGAFLFYVLGRDMYLKANEIQQDKINSLQNCPKPARCVKLSCIDNEVIVSGECVELKGNWLKLKKRMDNENN